MTAVATGRLATCEPMPAQIRKRVDEVAGLLAEKGTGLGGPWSDHLQGQIWELRLRLARVAVRVTNWCRPDGMIVMLTVFHKTRQHDQRQIDRAVRAQQACGIGPRQRDAASDRNQQRRNQRDQPIAHRQDGVGPQRVCNLHSLLQDANQKAREDIDRGN